MKTLSTRRFLVATREEWIRPSLKEEVFNTMNEISKNSNCKFVCFTNRKLNRFPTLQTIPMTKFQGIWKQAHAIFTFAPAHISTEEIHRKALLHAIPVITDDEGNHSYYINHLHTGYVMDHSKWQRDLKLAIQLMIKEPAVWLAMRSNAKRMERIYRGRDDGI